MQRFFEKASVKVHIYGQIVAFIATTASFIAFLSRGQVGLNRLLTHWALRALGRDRRGVTSLMLTVSAFALFGLAGLATEGGTWYLERRHGQNTADAAATAGVMAFAVDETGGGSPVSSDAVNTGTRVATDNGYTAGSSNGTATTVSITTGNYSSTSKTFTAGGSPLNAVKAVVTRAPPPLFSALFTTSGPTIRESAVATLYQTGPSCILTTTGGISFQGNGSLVAPSCAATSDSTTPPGISCSGSSSVTVAEFIASSTVTGCGSSTPALTFQPPTSNPMHALTALPLPSGPNPGGVSQNLTISNGQTVTLTPGIYYFASLNVKSGGTLSGPSGVTVVIGTGGLNLKGTMNINASLGCSTPSAPGDPNYPYCGVAVYDTEVNNDLKLNAGGSLTFSGGAYFPNANVEWNGNSAAGSNCALLVAASLTLSGTTNLAFSGCPTSIVPETQIVALVQ
jgi:Flp pilus assembly protein TadG